MKNEKIKLDPFVASLLPDSDKKMGAIASASIVVALALCLCATTYEQIIDDVVFVERKDDELTATIKVMDKKEEKKELSKKDKKPKQDIQRKRAGGGGKPKGTGNPHAPQSRGMLKILTAQTKNVGASPYDLIKQKFARDIDKVIKNTNGLQVTGKTAIGERRGKVDGAFNEGFASGGSGGIEGSFASLMGGSTGAFSNRAMKGNLKTPSARDIDVGSGNGTRSVSDIMKVVRKRTPGLRHIYNKFLKKKSGFSGKVTLKFTIAPSGEVITNVIVSSTTGFDEFDQEIKKAVSGWGFDKIKSGNTTVTIPFTFSE